MFKFLQKIFYQPRRPFPITDPIAYHLKKTFTAQLMGIKPISSLMYVIPAWRKKYAQLDINERIVEVPFILKNLPADTKAKALDVACCETIFPIQLASLGYQVTGLDIRPYELKHPNFTFLQEDICQTSLSANSFDVITCVSAIEHFGLNTIYGKSNQGTSDKNALESMFKLLKPGGKLLLTTPVAQQFYQSEFMKVYTPTQISQLFNKFKIVKQEYFSPNPQHNTWQKTSKNKLPAPPFFGVVTIIAQKPAHSRK